MLVGVISFLVWVTITALIVLAIVVLVTQAVVRPLRQAMEQKVLADWVHEQMLRVGFGRTVPLDRLVLRTVRAVKREVLCMPSGRSIAPAVIDVAFGPADLQQIEGIQQAVIDDVCELFTRTAAANGWELPCGRNHAEHRHDRSCAPHLVLTEDRLMLPGHPKASRRVGNISPATAMTEVASVTAKASPTAAITEPSFAPPKPTSSHQSCRPGRSRLYDPSAVTKRDDEFELHSRDGVSTVKLSASRRSLLIGRSKGCAMILNHPSVDLEHARLVRTDVGGWGIEPVGSTLKLLHNGNAVTERRSITRGDVLQIGGYVFDVAVSDECVAVGAIR